MDARKVSAFFIYPQKFSHSTQLSPLKEHNLFASTFAEEDYSYSIFFLYMGKSTVISLLTFKLLLNIFFQIFLHIKEGRYTITEIIALCLSVFALLQYFSLSVFWLTCQNCVRSSRVEQWILTTNVSVFVEEQQNQRETVSHRRMWFKP